MCAGIAAYALCDIYVLTRFTKRLLPDVYLRKELKALCPILLLSISMGLIIYICVSFIPILLFKLIVGIIIGGFIGGIIGVSIMCLLYYHN